MTRPLLFAALAAALGSLLVALVLSSPELRRRARPPLERLGLLRPYHESRPYLAIVERHARENAELAEPCVVLLGDSLTEGFPARLAAPRAWSVRGISGDRVRHVAARLPASALAAPCKTVALLIGSNDLVHDRSDPARVAAEIRSLAESLRQAHKRVLVATVPPTRGGFAGANGAIAALGELLRALRPDGFAVVDLYAALVDDSGELAAAYSRDGLHLTEAAYERWAAALDDALARPAD